MLPAVHVELQIHPSIRRAKKEETPKVPSISFVSLTTGTYIILQSLSGTFLDQYTLKWKLTQARYIAKNRVNNVELSIVKKRNNKVYEKKKS